MSIGKVITQTAVMILTGKVVSEGYERGKQKLSEYKLRKTKEIDEEVDPKQVGSVTQDEKPEAKQA